MIISTFGIKLNSIYNFLPLAVLIIDDLLKNPIFTGAALSLSLIEFIIIGLVILKILL